MKETAEMKETIVTTEQETEQEAVKPYTFRKLSAKEVVPMTSIIKKIGLKEFKVLFEGDGMEKIMSVFAEKNEDSTAEQVIEAVGFSVALELADIIFGNLEKVEADVFKLLAQVSNLTYEEVSDLELSVFAEMVIDFFKKEDFKDFFKVVSRSFK